MPLRVGNNAGLAWLEIPAGEQCGPLKGHFQTRGPGTALRLISEVQ